MYEIKEPKEAQEILNNLVLNCYIEKQKMKPWTVLTHPKYKTVTMILIINIFLIGMNGNFSSIAAYKVILKSITINKNTDTLNILIFAAILEIIKIIGMIKASKMLRNGVKNRKLALQYYASRITFFNILILPFLFYPFFNLS